MRSNRARSAASSGDLLLRIEVRAKMLTRNARNPLKLKDTNSRHALPLGHRTRRDSQLLGYTNPQPAMSA
jgi:hypothetical protein